MQLSNNDCKNEMIPDIKEFKYSLFDHQKTAIFKMEDMETTMEVHKPTVIYSTNIGLFSDEAGYGKTLSILGLIARNKFVLDNTTRLPNNKCGFATPAMLNLEIKQKTLITCPLSIVIQWSNEIKQTNLTSVIIKNRVQIETEPLTQDVIIVSPTMYNDFMIKYDHICWKRIIIDEPDTIVIPKMRTPCYGFLWLVSTTFLDRVNTKGRRDNFLSELSAQRGHHFHNFNIRNPISYIKSSIQLPDIINITHKVVRSIIVEHAMSHVSGSIKKMLNAGDIDGVLESLGAEKSSNLMDVLKKKIEDKIQYYTRLLAEASAFHYKRTESYIKRLEELNVEYVSINSQIKEILESECPICCDHINDKPVITPCCQNIFCGKCIIYWVQTKPSCPMCRMNLGLKDLICIKNNQVDSRAEVKEEVKEEVKKKTIMSKQDKLYNMVLNGVSVGKKWIIFSNYNNLFGSLTKILEDFRCAEMKGTITTRNKILNNFKHGKLDILLLNSKHSGAGINLYMATDVVLYNRFLKEDEYQCIHRGQRIGRCDPLTVHTFKVEHDYENDVENVW
jgi:SNF2 family DNA or RNA helicase